MLKTVSTRRSEESCVLDQLPQVQEPSHVPCAATRTPSVRRYARNADLLLQEALLLARRRPPVLLKRRALPRLPLPRRLRAPRRFRSPDPLSIAGCSQNGPIMTHFFVWVDQAFDSFREYGSFLQCKQRGNRSFTGIFCAHRFRSASTTHVFYKEEVRANSRFAGKRQEKAGGV